jgi:hypothetical protein
MLHVVLLVEQAGPQGAKFPYGGACISGGGLGAQPTQGPAHIDEEETPSQYEVASGGD